MISLQTNVNSLVAQQNMNVNSMFQSKTIDQLTSGYRINSSGDDAAGLAVANKFRSSVAELTQGVSNGNDGVAQLQIMDGGMSNISQILDRLKTLAMQSASDSFTGNRATLNTEFQTDIGEIDRQAQSIGLNAGGTFAKNLSVYLGAGSGSQSAANSVVNVDLSSATVDSNALGLTTYQAVNSNTYDLSSTSATSVSKILGDANNSTADSQVAKFTFYGQGFSNPTNSGTTNTGITISADLSGSSSATDVANAINTAIQKEANSSNAGDSSFQTAGIFASVVTDASGNQKLAFNSNGSVFQAAAGDMTANALMGNFNNSGTYSSTAATGQSPDAILATTGNTISSITAAAPLDLTSNSVQLTFVTGGVTASTNITLSGKYYSAASLVNDLQNQLNTNANTKNAGIQVSLVNGELQIDSKAGGTTALHVAELDSAATPTLGFNGASTTAPTSNAVVSSGLYGSFVSSGAHELGSSTGSTTSPTDLDFVALSTAADSQKLTITANDATGASHSLLVTLQGSGGNSQGTTLTKAVAYINQQLQESGDSTLQSMTAVVSNDNGNQTINFVSSLSNYSINVGANAAATRGVMVPNSTAGQTDTETTKVASVQVGSGGALDIGTAAGAQTAVGIITSAVSALGSAQAAVGIGENQLGFAISLAQSQITNLSAAESNIRDANVAQEAANLTKAQVLQQASIAAMAQANSAPQAILTLLRG